MADLVQIRRALISVSDKRGVAEFAGALSAMGVEIVSTGGTAAALRAAGTPIVSVEEVTGFPEVMDGRVKTLHPLIHAGILAVRDDEGHARAMREHGVRGIDLVCVSLYPFERTAAAPGATHEEAVEQIDVGGPAMIRAAAKNHAWVAVVTDPSQYREVLEAMRAGNGAAPLALRRRLAAAAFERTASYDRAIASYMARAAAGAGEEEADDALPAVLRPVLVRRRALRYGENPHQRAALYRVEGADAGGAPTLATARLLHGKEPGYNNYNDGAGALALAWELRRLGMGHACAVVKHANPCGAAVAGTVRGCVEGALAGDPVAAYGGILAVSSPVDGAAAEALCAPGVFLEVIIAPGFEEGALRALEARSAGLRLMEYEGVEDGAAPPGVVLRSIAGGLLAQTADDRPAEPSSWTLRAGPAPGAERLREAAVVWTTAKHLSSNAVAIGGSEGGRVRLFGAGAGQMDRVTACRLACEKAGALARGAVAASDAFFPFPDGPEHLIRAGVSVLVHPGGSKRDEETFALCERHGVSCLTTGVRHFRH